MMLLLGLFLLSFAHFAPAAPLHRRSASFSSLEGLTTLRRDCSRRESYTLPDKFFHEATFNAHYDGRFADEELSDDARTLHLRLLIQTYMETMQRIGVKTWIMHGCLLGWWWNGRVMPWDKDVDVMVDEQSIKELAGWWNMTVHNKFTANEPDPRGEFRVGRKNYLLEVNPNYTNTTTKDKHNVIDARWIDTSSGLYIDITTVHRAPIPSSLNMLSDDKEDDDIEMYTKDQHAYSYAQIFPLRETTFEFVTVKVPYAYEEILIEEYGKAALTDVQFNGYGFDTEKHEWTISDPTARQKVLLAKNKQASGEGRKVSERLDVAEDEECLGNASTAPNE